LLAIDKMDKPTVNEERIRLTAQRSQIVYLALGSLGLLYLISLVVRWDEQSAVSDGAETLLMMFVSMTTFLGLKQRSAWVIDLIRIVSVFWVVNAILSAFEPPGDLLGLLLKALGYVLGVFFLHQIFFFSKKEVRSFFRDRGKTLFG
jgi:hypothetical protein